MNGRVNMAINSVAGKIKRDTSESRGKQQVQSSNTKWHKPASLDLVVDNRRTTIVTVETKSRKGGSKMVSSGSAGRKAVDEKKLPGGNTDGRGNNWRRTLTEDNPALKQGIQRLAGQIQSSGHPRHGSSVRRETKVIGETQKSPKYTPDDNIILDEFPVKQAAKKPSKPPCSAVPSTTTIASSLGTVYVVDVEVQCGFDSNDKFSKFNPVKTLEFLMQQMESYVKDERASEILTDMEKALYKIPRELDEPSPAYLEETARYEAAVASWAADMKKLQARCTTLVEEKDQLQQQCERQAVSLEEAHLHRRNLENTIKQLKTTVNESQQRERNLESQMQQMCLELNDNTRTISELKDKNKGMQMLQKLITDLKRERDELQGNQNNMEVQYLKLGNEKLSTMSSYKDTRIEELTTELKDLKNHIAEQLAQIREAGERAKAANEKELSIIHGGAACSSPTSSSSNNSFVPTPDIILSEISLSTVEHFSNTSTRNKTHASKSQSIYFDGFDDTNVNRVREKTQLEFISLPGGDTSHTISLSQRKEDETRVPSCPDKKTRQERLSSGDRQIEEFHSAPNLREKESRSSSHCVGGKIEDTCSKSRKSSSADKKNRLIAEVNQGSGEPESIKKEIEMIFKDIRRQSKFPMHVPSPPRTYPNPDWSDTSLPTVSGMSGTNIV